MIIAVTGKFGSGKSHIANYIAEKTGLEIFHFDKYIIERLMQSKFKGTVERRIIAKLSLEHAHLLSNLQNLGRTLTKFEKNAILRLGNKKIKSILKSQTPIIIDFFGLPISKHFSKFEIKILVQSDESERFERLTTRNGFTPDQARQIDAIAADIVNYENHEFDHTIQNDYATIPPEIDGIIEPLTS